MINSFTVLRDFTCRDMSQDALMSLIQMLRSEDAEFHVDIDSDLRWWVRVGRHVGEGISLASALADCLHQMLEDPYPGLGGVEATLMLQKLVQE